VFDVVQRLDLRSFNKKAMESLILGGGVDCFETIDRSQYFAISDKHDTFLEHLLKYGNAYQNLQLQSVNSLFGDTSDVMMPEPTVPQAEPWSLIEKLTKEKEVTGIYISGHPLDDYRIEVENFTTCGLDRIENFKGQKVNIAGIITQAQHRVNKKGNGWGLFTVQDYNTALEFPLFTEDYQKFKHLLHQGAVL
jgi:DNA polymerase-3 subunit alpha